MKKATIDLEVIDNDEENPLDEIMSTVERYSLASQDFELKDLIEKKILHIERILQDFSETRSKRGFYLQKTVNELIKEYSISFFQKETKDNFELFNKSLDSLIQFSNKAKFNEVKYIEQNGQILSPIKYLKSKGYRHANINLYRQAATIALTHFDITNSNWFYHAEIKGFGANHKLYDTWDIELFFDTPLNESHKPLEFLYQFIEILNTINGVNIEIEDISLGSLTAKLKVLYESA